MYDAMENLTLDEMKQVNGGMIILPTAALAELTKRIVEKLVG